MIATCTWCGTDAYVDEYDSENDLALCTGSGHAEPRMFEPKAEQATRDAKTKALSALTDGIAAGLGLYDDLPPLVNAGEWAETGLIEYRYALAHPDTYAETLQRWGHVSQGPRRYSTTSFIGSTLGQLSRATNISYREGTGSGFAKGSRVGYWTQHPSADGQSEMSWEGFAAEAGLDPTVWPFI